jgi:hypothetical protein
MTSFFDKAARDVRDADILSVNQPDSAFLDRLADIEAEVFRKVCLVTGDREFPDDLREKMLGVIAVHGVANNELTPSEKARERAAMMRYSRAIEDLHGLFHELARRRVQTRFGWLSDSPDQILVLRDEWEAETFNKEDK